MPIPRFCRQVIGPGFRLLQSAHEPGLEALCEGLADPVSDEAEEHHLDEAPGVIEVTRRLGAALAGRDPLALEVEATP